MVQSDDDDVASLKTLFSVFVVCCDGESSGIGSIKRLLISKIQISSLSETARIDHIRSNRPF